MKKTISLFLAMVILIGGLFVGSKLIKNPPTNQPSTTTSTQNTGSVQGTNQVAAGTPVTLSIPKLNVSASVEQVELDSQKRMDVPKSVDDVGWYSLGYKPGDIGSAVMDGHLDTVTGAPAVFYYLSKLTTGDDVYVTDSNGNKLDFKVTDMETYPYDSLPLQKVFASNDKPRLNLITCKGTFDQGARNYSHRLVVYTELAQ